MSEFFLELFTEEIPSNLQISAREDLLNNIVQFLKKENITFDKNYFACSTPNRLVIYFKKIKNEIIKESKEIRGPKITSPKSALDGFLLANNINRGKLYTKKNDNGEFFFYKTIKTKIKTRVLLENKMPTLLSQIKWKKSMRWGNYDLYWGRPLKSIMVLYEGKALNFKFYHLRSNNTTYTDKNFEKDSKSFHNFKSYINYFKKNNIIINHEDRKKFIEKKLNKICQSKKLKLTLKEKLITEVTNIVDKPKIILCKFDKRFLNMPQELIISTIEHHQKFFLVYDENYKLTNNFLIVANCEDRKGFIKIGNERVVETRLSDAEYFWVKNKSKNMIKQVSKLKNINYFNGLGSYFDKVQRLKKLSGLISDELLISKDKVEIASTICKVDLLSDLVNEFPELQGVLGGYFAEEQGFEKEVSMSIKEQYFPTGQNAKIPKNNYSIALSVSDKIDTLVGFFALNLAPTSSKDPYALRRLAIGLIKIIIENKKKLKINEIINYSYQLYVNQLIKFDDKYSHAALQNFLIDRFKNFMREKGIRHDIIESSLSNYNLNHLLEIYIKANKLNKIINKQVGHDLIENYKRAFKIINSEKELNKNENFIENADPTLFNNDYEKNLYKKIYDIRKNFTSIKIENDYDSQLNLLASIKQEITNFFDNVIVNDSDDKIKNNRLKLLNMVCTTFDNYLSFSKIETI
tara:strand:- start:1342 stop:3414 length:2073 start_codon:yes stop_codon:yes gene_type:complete